MGEASGDPHRHSTRFYSLGQLVQLKRRNGIKHGDLIGHPGREHDCGDELVHHAVTSYCRRI